MISNRYHDLPYPQSGIDKYGPYEYALPVRFGSDLQCLATNLQATIKTIYQPIYESCKSLCSKALPSLRSTPRE